MRLPADYDPKCNYCGARVYRYMVTPRRTVWRALPEWVESSPRIPWGHWAADPKGSEPLVCERVEAGETELTLQHTTERDLPR